MPSSPFFRANSSAAEMNSSNVYFRSRIRCSRTVLPAPSSAASDSVAVMTTFSPRPRLPSFLAAGWRAHVVPARRVNAQADFGLSWLARRPRARPLGDDARERYRPELAARLHAAGAMATTRMPPARSAPTARVPPTSRVEGRLSGRASRPLRGGGPWSIRGRLRDVRAPRRSGVDQG